MAEKQYKEAMLTTTDNPWDPFDNFYEWYREDQRLAQDQCRATCCGYLAKLMPCTDEVSEEEYNQVQNDVIDEIVELDLSGTFKKVTRDPVDVIVEAS